MNSALIVVRPFATHVVGDVITDAGKAAELLAGEHAHDVVRVPYDQETLPPVRSAAGPSLVRDGEG